MSKEETKNLLKNVNLNDVMRNALSPGTVPAPAAFLGGQSVALPDGSKFMVINTDQCKAPDTWDRPNSIEESIAKLKVSLKEEADKNRTEYGNHDPIIVQGKAPEFEILSGKSRWMAAKDLKLKILVRVMPKVREGLDRAYFEVMANGARTSLDPVEVIKASLLLTERGAKPAHIASALGRSVQSIYKYLQVGKDPALMAQLQSGEISYKDASNQGGFGFHKTVSLETEAADAKGSKTNKKAGEKGIDQGPLRFTEYDEQKKIIALSLRLRDATKADKKKALKLLLQMIERLNQELNPLDPRKKDRRAKDAVTPSKRRKVDRD